ncbi:unnamed protein product, partial [marine sediment metagenome]
MSLQVKKETGVVYDPVFLKILEDIPGGVTVTTDRFPTATREIKKGALLSASASSVGLYNLIKTAKAIHTVLAITSATLMYIDPKNEFKVGEYINYGAGVAASIVSITEGAVSDAVLVAHSIEVVIPAAAVLYESSASGTTLALYAADAILKDTIKVRDDKGTLLDNLFAGAVV